MRRILFELKELVIFLVRAVYSLIENGNTCIICGRKTFVIPLCKKCIHNFFNVLLKVNSSRCEKCGKELISNVKYCSSCGEDSILKSTDKVIPLFSYRLWNKELLYLWKIKEERALSPLFAHFVYETMKLINEKIIVPVPPRKGKIQKNGWDQIDELCKYLNYRYGYTVLNILERNTVQQQKKLNREKRLETIKSAYSLVQNKEFIKQLNKTEGKLPESVVLIDDVCTTGATVESCAEILKSAGISKVNVVTLFIVD